MKHSTKGWSKLIGRNQHHCLLQRQVQHGNLTEKCTGQLTMLALHNYSITNYGWLNNKLCNINNYCNLVTETANFLNNKHHHSWHGSSQYQASNEKIHEIGNNKTMSQRTIEVMVVQIIKVNKQCFHFMLYTTVLQNLQ